MSAALQNEAKKAPAKAARKTPAKKTAVAAEAPANDGTTSYIPFNKLFRSPLNVRRTMPAAAIEELAANIKAMGLIQSLAVVPDGDGFGVVAGGRRFLAMKLLAERDEWSETTPVLCRIVTPEEAEEISLAENVQRHAMHPADQFEAFSRLVDAGRTVEEVAQRFGVSASIVIKRLKLAAVAPSVMEAFREDRLTLEQVTAFAISDDHDAQTNVLQWVLDTHFQVAPHSIKGRLMQGSITESSRLVSFVGLDAYTAAGGTVVHDLFGENGYLTDAALLHELAETKLADLEASVREEGWLWVERVPDRPNWFYSAQRLSPSEGDNTPEQAARISEIADRLAAIEEGSAEEGLTDEEDAEYDALTVELDEIRAASRHWTDEQKAEAGVFILTEGHEIGTVHRGLVKPGSRKQQNAASNGAQEAGESPATGIPAGLTETLYRERTAALQAALSRDSVMILRVLVHAMLSDYYGAMSPRFETPETPQDKATNPALCAVAEYRLQHLNPLRIPQSPDLWPWLLKQDETSLIDILAACALPYVNAGREDWSAENQRTPAREIASTIGFDMREWWKPDADNFFRSLTKATIADCITQAGGSPGEWQKAKRDALAADAASTAAKAEWLPAFLCTPDGPQG